MGEVTVKADLTQAIETLSDKLGIASKEIVHHYRNWMSVKGFMGIAGGLCLLGIPWLLFWPIRLAQNLPEYGSDVFYFAYGAKWIVCGLGTFLGAWRIFDSVVKIAAPEAEAINKLIWDIKSKSD